MPDERRATGRAGESRALDHLRAHGYEIVATNWRTRYGEIDIVALQRDTIVIVEVRSRRSASLGTAAESVDARKQRQLVRMAESYLQQHAPHAAARIDVISVQGETVEHLIGVVDGH